MVKYLFALVSRPWEYTIDANALFLKVLEVQAGQDVAIYHQTTFREIFNYAQWRDITKCVILQIIVNRSLALGPCVKKYTNDLALMVNCDGNMREPILNLLADHNLKDG